MDIEYTWILFSLLIWNSFIGLKIKITKLLNRLMTWFSILGKLHIGNVMVLGYLNLAMVVSYFSSSPLMLGAQPLVIQMKLQEF